MLILDTNVVSEMMRREPDRRVVDWLARQDPGEVHLTALTVAEISFGLECLPDGRRQRDLGRRFAHVVEHGFAGRVLAFDQEAGLAYGRIMAAWRATGRPMSVVDGQIAAIATVRDAALATRNLADFEGCDLTLVNPFVARSASRSTPLHRPALAGIRRGPRRSRRPAPHSFSQEHASCPS